jgi:tRNA G18 (ribose-2'-O)-methylase SpoU
MYSKSSAAMNFGRNRQGYRNLSPPLPNSNLTNQKVMSSNYEKIFAILHNIRSCYNVGAIFRTCDAIAIEKIYLTGYTPTPERNPEKIRKTALGAEETVKWEYEKNIGKLTEKLKKEGIKIVALETEKSALPYFKFKPKFPLAILVGNEKRGIDKRTLKKADFIVKIPMFGKKESLNVAVAFSIFAYYLKIESLK